MARKKTSKKMPNGAGSVTLRSDGRWMGRYSVRDPETGKSLRRYVYGSSEQQVRAALVAAMAARNAGTLTIARGRGLTVEAYAKQWLAGREGRIRPRSIDRYQQLLDTHIVPRIGKVQLKALTPSQVERLMNDVVAAGLSTRTANYVRVTIRAMLAQAERDGHVGRNVAALATSLPERDDRLRVLTPQQAQVLLAAAESDPDGNLWTVALATGARQSELLGLRWADVDLEAKRLRIERTLQFRHGSGFLVQPTKTDKSTREIGLPEIAAQALRRQRQDYLERRMKAGATWISTHGELIFSGSLGEPLVGTTVTKTFQRRLATLGLPVVPFHALRHTAVSLLAANKVPMFDTSRTMGHSSINVTSDKYGALFDESRTAVANAMDAALTTK